MNQVTVSPKYQIVIPRKIRESMKIRPGQKLIMVAEERSIRLMPERSIKEIRALLRGIPGEFEREPDREL
jgi:AbrB family looped-hinge helix DNA binding protein